MRILPAIDLIDGKCVRLKQGDFAQKTIYSADPVEVAMGFEQAGLKYLHLVDLDGAKGGKPTNLDILERIASKTSLTIDFGGGISSIQNLKDVLNAGADQVNIGSLAVRDPELVKEWINAYGPKIVLSADVRGRNIATNAWQDASEITLMDFLTDFSTAGLQYVACTDVSKDGMMSGPAVELYEELSASFNLRLIASGGVSTPQDLEKLASLQLDGVIIGKAIYEGTITFEELVRYA